MADDKDGIYVSRRYVAMRPGAHVPCYSVGLRDPFAHHKTPIWLRFHSDTACSTSSIPTLSLRMWPVAWSRAAGICGYRSMFQRVWMSTESSRRWSRKLTRLWMPRTEVWGLGERGQEAVPSPSTFTFNSFK